MFVLVQGALGSCSAQRATYIAHNTVSLLNIHSKRPKTHKAGMSSVKWFPRNEPNVLNKIIIFITIQYLFIAQTSILAN